MIAALLVAIGLASPSGGYFDPFEPTYGANEAAAAVQFDGEFSHPPSFAWRKKLPGLPLNSATHAEWSNPVVTDQGILLGSAAGKALYLLSRFDGSVLRSFPASASVESPAAVHDGKVYFSDTAGNTWCYELEDGSLIWQHDGSAPVLVAPTIVDDLIIITNVDDLASAHNRSTGELVWQYRAKRDLTRVAELSLYAAPRAVVHDGTVLLGFSSDALVGVDLETGEERWSRDIGEGRYPDLVAEPVLGAAGELYSTGYFKPLVSLDLESKTVRWRVEAGSAHEVVVDPNGPIGSVVYHPGTDGTLRAVGALTGAMKWTWRSGTQGALTAPVIVDAGLIVGSSDGAIHLIDPETGKSIWRWHERWKLRGISSAPVVAGRQLLFVSNAGYLYSMLSVKRTPERPAWP